MTDSMSFVFQPCVFEFYKARRFETWSHGIGRSALAVFTTDAIFLVALITHKRILRWLLSRRVAGCVPKPYIFPS